MTLDRYLEEPPDHNAHEPPEQASREGRGGCQAQGNICSRDGLVMALVRGGELA